MRSGQRLVEVIVGIVDVDDVDPINVQPVEAALERPPHGVVAEVELRRHLAVRAYLEQAADLGGDHHSLPPAPQGGAEADLGFTSP